MSAEEQTLPEQEREEARAAEDAAPPQNDDRPTAQELAEEEPIDATVVEEDGGERLATRQEVEAAVQEALASTELTVVSRDSHEGMVAMDAHDAIRFVDRLVEQAQLTNLGKRWVYQLPYGGGDGLTVDAVQDITQQMNWTGKARITTLPETLQVEVIEADEGRGPEKFWVATIFAEDEMTGQTHGGSSMEPQYMQLKTETAQAKRNKGALIPEDNRVFDRFARTKAINKAERNAGEKHIPELVKLTLIAMAKNKPQMIERIQTEQEAKAADWPAPLTTPEAEALQGEIRAVYDEVRDLGGGRGRVELPPGKFHAYLMQSAHDMEKLAGMKVWILEQRDAIAAKFGDAS